MINQKYILCLNSAHESIVLDFFHDIQEIIDNATEKDDDYHSFLSVLTTIILRHNERGEVAYKDTIFRNNWLYDLPSMVYWASLGYVSVLKNKNEDIILITARLSARLDEVNLNIDRMILSEGDSDENETGLA